MKRATLVILPILLVFGALVLWGRPPSRYVLESEAARFQQERLESFVLFSREIAIAARDGMPTEPLRTELDRRMLQSHELRLGGWNVVLLPPGAKAPGPDHRSWGTVDPTRLGEPLPIAGPWRVNMKPLSWTARLADLCGLGP